MKQKIEVEIEIPKFLNGALIKRPNKQNKDYIYLYITGAVNDGYYDYNYNNHKFNQYPTSFYYNCIVQENSFADCKESIRIRPGTFLTFDCKELEEIGEIIVPINDIIEADTEENLTQRLKDWEKSS